MSILRSGEIINALASKYGAPEYAFLCEVRNQTGFGRTVRSADALAMSLWPSRGIYMTGFEVKVSRADWVKELKDPAKAEELARFCRNWFVAAPAGIVKLEELPVNWGLIEVSAAGKLKYVKPASVMNAQEPTWTFFAALAKQMTLKWTPTSQLNKQIRAREEELVKANEANRGYREKQLQESINRINSRVAQFERASGIELDRYSEYFTGEIGEAVKIVRSMGTGGPLDRLIQAKLQIQGLCASIESLEKSIKAGS